jgi:hypothetical protein
MPTQQFFRRAQGESATNRENSLLGPAPRHIRVISAIFKGYLPKNWKISQKKA